MSDHFYRKTGELLVIKGTLDGDDLPETPWTGATAKFHARVAGSSTVWRTENVTLNIDTREFTYSGAAPIDADANEYRGEIEVTFGDGTKKTWPSDGYLEFTILKQIA